MRISVSALIVSCLCAASCLAQSSSSSEQNTQAINAQNANNVCRVYFSTPKPGASQQYEAGRKKHMQFHRDQKDTWTWNTYAIETGDNAGTFVTSSCGHAWKDLDEWEARMGKADIVDGANNLTPYIQGGRNGVYVYRSDMSLAPASQTPSPMTAVTIFVLHPGAAPDFTEAVKKINEALRKQADWPKTSGWLQLVNGGEGPTFVLLNSRKNWGDFAPLTKTVADVLNEVYGKESADQIQKTIRDSTAHQFTEEAAYRADLSYQPGK
ncbi:MAG: hypothetical protein M3O09_04980 [Acidobacteriota bacterium]|nr:hypothetical protein [Acidobacteriota bacterium]